MRYLDWLGHSGLSQPMFLGECSARGFQAHLLYPSPITQKPAQHLPGSVFLGGAFEL
jgi:hypothetical protein